jgi:glutathione S-transferase
MMILIGQYDSSYVRRVGIALTLYGIPFEHRPWSTFGDAEKIAAFNPLMRVPTLVLGDGTVLAETFAILDYLDALVPPDRAMTPRGEPARHRALRISALASGIADMFVSLFYEQRLHEGASPMLIARRTSQIAGALAVLEAERAAVQSTYLFGGRIGHADIAVAAVLRHLGEAHPGLIDMTHYPALAGHAAQLESLPVFTQIFQVFDVPGVGG